MIELVPELSPHKFGNDHWWCVWSCTLRETATYRYILWFDIDVYKVSNRAVRRCLMPKCCKNSLNWKEVNCGPLSIIITSGIPHLVNSSWRVWITVVDVTTLVVATSGHLECKSWTPIMKRCDWYDVEFSSNIDLELCPGALGAIQFAAWVAVWA